MKSMVYTETSRYIIDTDEMTATRIPGEGKGQKQDELIPAVLAECRRDGETVQMHDVKNMEVGKRMELFLQIVDDPSIITVRRTTFVRAIEEIN